MVAFQVAQNGCHGEDLFGTIACLLGLLGKGANSFLKSSLSISALFGTEQQSEDYDPETLDPLQLAKRVPRTFLINWSEEARIGCQVFCLVLQLSQKSGPPDPSHRGNLRADSSRDEFDRLIQYVDDAMNVDGEEGVMDFKDDNISTEEEILRVYDECGERKFFRGNTDLRDLCASTQAELLTYRRLQAGDPWTSQNINLEEILNHYQDGHGIRTCLIEGEMLKEYCDCGRIQGAEDADCNRGLWSGAKTFTSWIMRQFLSLVLSRWALPQPPATTIFHR